MAKEQRVTSRQAITVLVRRGFFFSRQVGSHAIYRNAEGKRATVPVHGAKILHPKIVKTIREDLGLSVEEFRELL